MVSLEGKDILDGAQFTRPELEHIMHVAAEMRSLVAEKRKFALMEGYVMAALFFEPSTRTRLSFETAMHRLGGDVVGFSSAGGTSATAKEETHMAAANITTATTIRLLMG